MNQSDAHIAAFQDAKRLDKNLPRITFNGFEWWVKTGRTGPANNLWLKENVSVESDGLHLKVRKTAEEWSAAEVIRRLNTSYGTYVFYVKSRLDHLAKNVVLGLFTYDSDSRDKDTREIDIEFLNGVGNFAVHRPDKPYVQSFPLELLGDQTMHLFTWTPAGIKFWSLHGHYEPEYAVKNCDRIAEWSFNGNIPDSFSLSARINLWIKADKEPCNEAEVIISDFKYLSL